MLPEVKRSSGDFGKTVKIGALPAGIAIAGVAGTSRLRSSARGVFLPGRMKNTYGTGSFILLNAGKKRVVSRYGLITTLACGAKGEPVYALEGAVFVAGSAVQWLRDKLHLLRSAAESEKLAQGTGDNGGVYFVPALVGLGAPYWDPEARGRSMGLRAGQMQAT